MDSSGMDSSTSMFTETTPLPMYSTQRLSIPDESIVPYTLESMVSAICVSGTFLGNNQFRMTVCATIILKVLADVEVLIPSYGFCPIPPCEEFAESVCDEQ